MKRFLLAFVAAYIFIFVWGWLVNGFVLKSVYVQWADLFRSREEMGALFHFILLGNALIVLSFLLIYASGFAGGGVTAGVKLGLMLEIAAIGMRLVIYAVQPFPGKLLVYSSINGLLEMALVGAIVGAIYKPAAAQRA